MNFEWAHLIIGLASAALGGIAGIIAGVWRIAHIEQALRDDFMRSLATAESAIEDKVESLVGQFQEAFSGLRQKINDVELQTEKHFLSKDGFNDFRKEYRDDMSRLMDKIDNINKHTS